MSGGEEWIRTINQGLMSTQAALATTPSQRLLVGQSPLDVVLMSFLDFLLRSAKRVNTLRTNRVRENPHADNGQNEFWYQASLLDAWPGR